MKEDKNNEAANEALIAAVKAKDLEAVKIALQNGADVSYNPGRFGVTALMWTIVAGNLEVAKLLIEAGADVNSIDYNDYTVLMKAVYGGNLELVKYLVVNGANVHATMDTASEPETAMVYAAEHMQFKIVNWLLFSQHDCFITEENKLDQDQHMLLCSKLGEKITSNTASAIEEIMKTINVRLFLTEIYLTFQENRVRLEEIAQIFIVALEDDFELVCSDLHAMRMGRHKVITDDDMVKGIIDALLQRESELTHQQRCQLLVEIAPMLEPAQTITILQHLDLEEISRNKDNASRFLDLAMTLYEYAIGFQQSHDERAGRLATQLQCYAFVLLCLGEEDLEETELARVTLLAQLADLDKAPLTFDATLKEISSAKRGSVLDRIIRHTNAEGLRPQLEKIFGLEASKTEQQSPTPLAQQSVSSSILI